jgi:hypothetical protein
VSTLILLVNTSQMLTLLILDVGHHSKVRLKEGHQSTCAEADQDSISGHRSISSNGGTFPHLAS